MFKGTDWFLFAVRQYLSLHPHVRDLLIDEIVRTFDSESWEMFRRKYHLGASDDTDTTAHTLSINEEGDDNNDNTNGTGNLR